MSNGMPMISIEIMAAITTTIVATLGFDFGPGKNMKFSFSDDNSKEMIIIKTFNEIIGNVAEIDNKITNRVPQSLSDEGAKNKMDAIPGQIEPEINRSEKII